MTDAGERTEQATPKRLKEARDKGKLSTSKDLVGWVTIGAVMIAVPGVIVAAQNSTSRLVLTIGPVIAQPSIDRAMDYFLDAMGTLGGILAPAFAVAVIAVLVSSFVQGGIHIKTPAPKFEQLNLFAGIKRVFGTQALWEGAKSLAKTAIVGMVLYTVIQGLVPTLLNAGGLPITSLLNAGADGVGSIVRGAVIAGLLLGGLDMIVVMRRNLKQTRMTKKEVKDENKASDGDPLVRQQRRSRQIAMSRTRMIASVADADVVMLNPTHIAVALRYEPGKSAPRIVAKGQGEVATRIRERADAAGVPMVQDIPLARALHAACEVGQEIPEELYAAVARVLALVLSLKSKGAARGVHTTPTAAA